MNRLIALLICIGSFLPAESQVTHYLAKKGTEVDFDTAMVIKLEAYRKEFQIQQAQNRLLDSLHHLLTTQQQQVPSLAAPSAVLTVAEQAQGQPVVVKEKKKLKWYFNPLMYLGAGLLMGVYLVD